jgi:hypothetical protein
MCTSRLSARIEMGLFVALGIGYVIGARAGSKDLGAVMTSLKAVRESEEFHDLIKAVRSHLGSTLRELANLVDERVADDEGVADTAGAQDLVERVRHLVGRDVAPG